MRKRTLSVLLFALFAVPAVSCGKPEPVVGPDTVTVRPQPGEYALPLIETTDMHGYIVSTDNNGNVHYRLAYIADKVDDIRGHGDQCKKDRILLLDGGDLYQGASVSNLLAGWPVYVSLDMMGYDAVAVGNHEFDWGIESLVESDATLPDYQWNGQDCVNEVPVLCANLYQNGSKASFTRDYVIVEKTAVGAHGATVPVKIGIVGFAVNYSGSIMATQFTGKGYTIKEDFSIANTIAADLETNHGCDATILLIHGDAPRVAESLGNASAFDIVLGGHSHYSYAAQTSWGLPYVQGGRYCERYSYANLKFNVDSEGKISFKNIGGFFSQSVNSSRDTRTYAGENAEDLADYIIAVCDAALEATEEQQKEVIGYIDKGATTSYISGSGERAASVSNWMCDIIRRIGEADVAFVNSGGIRTSFPLNGQSRRDITVANVYELFPFSNTTYVYRITYADLLSLLEYSMTSAGESLFSRMTGIDCYFTRQDHGSYTTSAVHSLQKDGTVIYQNGTWTGDWASHTLILAVSEYLATTERTDEYTHLPNPLAGWNTTERLQSCSMVDNENAVRVLKAEAASSGGHLYIDTAPHYILHN